MWHHDDADDDGAAFLKKKKIKTKKLLKIFYRDQYSFRT
jgi:hypothetical protein